MPILSAWHFCALQGRGSSEAVSRGDLVKQDWSGTVLIAQPNCELSEPLRLHQRLSFMLISQTPIANLGTNRCSIHQQMAVIRPHNDPGWYFTISGITDRSLIINPTPTTVCS